MSPLMASIPLNAVAIRYAVGIRVVGECSADLDGPDLSLHSGRVGSVEVGVCEFLKSPQPHRTDADANLVVSREFDVFNNFGIGMPLAMSIA